MNISLLPGRWEGAVLSAAAGAAALAGFLGALGSQKRALHDRLTGTAVFYRRYFS